MPDIKYLVTVNAETCTVTKLERIEGDGALKPIDLGKLRFDLGTAAGAGIVINIYGGGAPVSPTGGVKITDGDDICISFPGKPPGGPPIAR
jgi:hypothetical protein